MTRRTLSLVLLLLCVPVALWAQDTTWQQLPGHYLSTVSHRVGALQAKLDKKSQAVLQDFQRGEEKLYRRLLKKDSTRAAQFLASSQEQYRLLEQRLQGPQELSQYLPFLDTLNTSLQFLKDNPQWLAKSKEAGKELSGTLAKVQGVEGELAKAESIRQFLRQRRGQLKEQLEGLPFAGELKKLNKQAYYYSAQVQEYKEVLKDPKKIERKALALLSKTEPYQKFMREHSGLAALFRLPGGGGTADPSVALQGLQTRAQVNGLIQQRIAAGGPGAQAQVQVNLQAAQGQLSALKNQLAQYSQGSYGNSSSEMEVPDFKPNGQKTKSFLKRLEVGTNLQSQRARYFFPVTSDLGLSVGYKLNDNSVLGVGASYKLGLGEGWQRVALSHQGLGLRSFVDWRLKGSLYLSGGYEQNYRSEIHSIDQLKEYSAWQVSGLVGLSKRYKVSKKLRGEMKLLWDFMSYQQVPRTQAVLVRVGYSLK